MGLSFEGLQQSINSPVATDVGPSLAVFNNKLYAAWKGSNGDERIWFSSFDGASWSLPSGAAQQSMPDPIATSFRPSLATFNNELYAAWKGSNGDTRIWFSSFDGTKWAPQKTISMLNVQVGTDVGPSLAVFNNRLYVAWKGSNGDERIWYSFSLPELLPGTPISSWQQQQSMLNPIASSVGPSLATFNNKLYAAWKGSTGDERIWYSFFDGSIWAKQEPLPSPIASSVGPSLAVFNNRLYVAWKGSNGDTRIWWTSATE